MTSTLAHATFEPSIWWRKPPRIFEIRTPAVRRVIRAEKGTYMKTYKLVEYRPESIADAWATAKETLRKIMDSLNEEFSKQSQSIETACGQRCIDVRLHSPTKNEWIYLGREGWSIHGPGFFIKRESLRGNVDLPLRRVNEIIKWISEITPADITQKIEEAL